MQTHNEKDGDEGLHVIISDTGNTLHEFRNAQAAWTDHTEKEWGGFVITASGEEKSWHCGKIIYSAPEAKSDAAPTPEELIEKHTSTFTGEHNWGHVV